MSRGRPWVQVGEPAWRGGRSPSSPARRSDSNPLSPTEQLLMHLIPHRVPPTTTRAAIAVCICRAFDGGARWENTTRKAGRGGAARANARELAASRAVPPLGVHRPLASHPAIPSGHVSPATPTRRLGLAVLAALVVAVAAGCGSEKETSADPAAVVPARAPVY